MKKRIIIFLLAINTFNVLADSPLTSTFFAMAYNDVPTIGTIMQRRMSEGIYNIPLIAEYIKFLDDPNNSLDQKIALINGLGWGEVSNTEIYIQHLMKKYVLSHSEFDSLLVFRDDENMDLWPSCKVINAHDLISLGYLQIMGDYFNPLAAGNVVEYAYSLIEDSQAAACVVGLLISQYMLDINWCGVYQGMNVLRDGIFTRDIMRPDALLAINEYIDLYAASCLEDEMTVGINTETVAEELGKMVTNLDYYNEHPCYTVPVTKQVSDTKNDIDLKLLNKHGSNDRMHETWINYNEQTQGTDIIISIKNMGNTQSIATNLLIKISEDNDMTEMFLQTEIPAINANATIELTIQLRDYWIYDPDASFEIILDLDNNIIETDEENNREYFFEQG